MSVSSLCGNGPDYYGNRRRNLNATVTNVGRNHWILYHLFLSKIHTGDLEHPRKFRLSLTKTSLQKVKRIAIHSVTGKIQYSHFFDLTFKESLARQTEEKNPHEELALPESVNTDSSQAMEVNDTDITLTMFFPRIDTYFYAKIQGISF